MTDLTLGIRLTADGSGFVGEVKVSKDALGGLGDEADKASKKAKSFAEKLTDALRDAGKEIKRVGRDLSLSVTAPLTAAGVASGKAAAEFDESLSRIVGLVGLAGEEVAGFRDQLLQLGPQTGKGPRELAEALFFVTSAGARGAEAMAILKASAQAAAAGLGDTATVADAVTSAIGAYGAANLSAGRATGILVAAVREGKAEASAIAGALGAVLPIASELGVGFDQVAASVAAMTRLGLDASQSATALRGVLAALLKPTAEAEKLLAEAGLSAAGLKAEIREKGLLAVLLALKDTFAGNDAALTALFPNIEGLTGVLNLVGANAETTQAIFASLAATTEADLAKAFAVAAETSSHKFRELSAQVDVLRIRLGEALLPMVIPLMERLVAVIEQVAAGFAALDPETQKTVLVVGALAAAIGPALIVLGSLTAAIGALIPVVTAVGTAFLALVAAAGGPITLVIAAVAALTAAWFLWGDDVTRVVGATVEAVRSFLVDKFGAVVEAVREKVAKVTGFFKDAYREIVGNSIVPDMIDAIGVEFGRLDGVMVDPTDRAAGRMEKSFDRAGDRVADSLGRMVERGQVTLEGFAGVVTAVVDDIVQDLVRIQFTDPLRQVARGGLDWLTNALRPAPALPLPPNGVQLVPVAHGGGHLGSDSFATRQVPSWLFAGAPRHHSGYIAPGERPAILRNDESVLTPGQMKALGGAGAVSVQIVNTTGEPARVTRNTQRGDGTRELQVMVGQAIAADFDAGGPAAQALERNFGAARQGRRR